LVAVVSLSSSSTLIGFTQAHPSTGALILAQPAVKVIVTKSVQMGRDFGHTFGPSLSGFEGSQAGFLGPCPTQSPVTIKPGQRSEQFADGGDGR
jgi:hypothetical protein